MIDGFINGEKIITDKTISEIGKMGQPHNGWGMWQTPEDSNSADTKKPICYAPNHKCLCIQERWNSLDNDYSCAFLDPEDNYKFIGWMAKRFCNFGE